MNHILIAVAIGVLVAAARWLWESVWNRRHRARLAQAYLACRAVGHKWDVVHAAHSEVHFRCDCCRMVKVKRIERP